MHPTNVQKRLCSHFIQYFWLDVPQKQQEESPAARLLPQTALDCFGLLWIAAAGTALKRKNAAGWHTAKPKDQTPGSRTETGFPKQEGFKTRGGGKARKTKKAAKDVGKGGGEALACWSFRY